MNWIFTEALMRSTQAIPRTWAKVLSALDLFKTVVPDFIFLDIKCPVWTGLNVFANKELPDFKEVPVIYILRDKWRGLQTGCCLRCLRLCAQGDMIPKTCGDIRRITAKQRTKFLWKFKKPASVTVAGKLLIPSTRLDGFIPTSAAPAPDILLTMLSNREPEYTTTGSWKPVITF